MLAQSRRIKEWRMGDESTGLILWSFRFPAMKTAATASAK
jgi:hypothetical protein